MYQLNDSLLVVKGIGPKVYEAFEEYGITTVKQLLLHLPFRYEDRSERYTIDQIKQFAINKEKKLFTLHAWVKSSRSNFFRGRSLQSATLTDETGTIQASWFNNPYIVKRLKSGEAYLFSGQASVSKTGKIFLTQPVVEDVDKEAIHTDRLVPIYSSIPDINPTVLRKFQKEILDHLKDVPDSLLRHSREGGNPEVRLSLSINESLKVIHFPDSADSVIAARERFAVEELMLLIEHSHQLKEEWRREKTTVQILDEKLNVPETIPFELTKSQLRSASEIIKDLTETHPMNRLLIGDVGSGKTIVAGLAMQKVIDAGYHAGLVAPTQILAEQHTKTLQKFFPDVPIYLVTGKTKPEFDKPGFIVGTHAVLNILKKLGIRSQVSGVKKTKTETQHPKPNTLIPVGLIVFDEQHRFGVSQRSALEHAGIHPHVLTMTATPIPRSLMLTIFSHLSLSTIDELPKNRIPTKTWVLSEAKREKMYGWLKEQIIAGHRSQVTGVRKEISKTNEPTPDTLHLIPKFQTIIVCPFINPSESEALENVAAAKEMFETVVKKFKSKNKKTAITVDLLHSKLKKTDKERVIADLFAGKIDVLVTTPIVEVGVDLPQASAIVIEAAERFGFASLHQLRGRVGRAGQQGYCLLFSSNKKISDRLKKFEGTTSGQELAELDLQNRGAGDLFGTQQHGFDELKFASWTDLEQIRKAKTIIEKYRTEKKKYVSPLLEVRVQKTVLAN